MASDMGAPLLRMKVERSDCLGAAIACRPKQKIGIDTCKEKRCGAQADQFGVIGHIADAPNHEGLPCPPAGVNGHFVSFPNTRMRVLSRDPQFSTEIIGANAHKIHAGQRGNSLDILDTARAFEL
jgi:hypothetical protein